MNSPNGKYGYDCSGYAQACLRALGAIGHSVDWMRASDMYNASTRINASDVRAGDCAFYAASSSSSVCHVTLCTGPVQSNGLAPIIGANGGGSSTLGDDPGANVRYDDAYWSSGLVGYGRFEYHGTSQDDLLLALGLHLAWMYGHTDPANLPDNKEGWRLVSEIFKGRDPVDYTGTLSLGEVYAPLMAMYTGQASTWDKVIGWSTSAVASAYSAVEEVVSGGYQYLSGGDDDEGGSAADAVAADASAEGSWLDDWTWDAWWSDDDDGTTEADAAAEADDSSWWGW